jgi:putative hydrolase of the HAD superfamily
MIKAVIFDVDDTLQDWPAAIEQAIAGAATELPEALRGTAPERVQRAIVERYYVVREGRVVNREHWRLLFEAAATWKVALPDVEQASVEQAAKRFQSLLEPVPYADAQPALEALRGYTLATLSNSPRSEDSLRKLGLREFFSTVVSAVDEWRKPDRRAFERVCDAVGVTAGDALYVGDSLSHDVEGAIGAGISPVWLDRYETPGETPAGARRIASLAELAQLVQSLNS